MHMHITYTSLKSSYWKYRKRLSKMVIMQTFILVFYSISASSQENKARQKLYPTFTSKILLWQKFVTFFLQHYDSSTFACSKGKICSFHGPVYLCVNRQPWKLRANLEVFVWYRLWESKKHYICLRITLPR